VALQLAHRKEKDKRIADRIKTVLSLNKGYSFEEISALLLLDDSTLRSHYKVYIDEGIEGLLRYNYVSGLSYLSPDEQAGLDAHLESTFYHSSKEIRAYIEGTYGVKYTQQGVRALLKRLKFVYKQTKHLPSKGDIEKQKEFERQYRALKSNKAPDDEIYFMDGVHPMHNSITGSGWIKKGTEKLVKSNTGRARLNINGMCNTEKIEVLIHEGTSVNAQSTIALFDKAQLHQPKGKINVISDNARYYRSKLVREYLEKNTRINLIFLPSYSPNLNIIERLWKFFKKKILYDEYYEKFETFKEKSLGFFQNIDYYREDLKTLLVDNFQFYHKTKYS
jgi:transposase